MPIVFLSRIGWSIGCQQPFRMTSVLAQTPCRPRPDRNTAPVFSGNRLAFAPTCKRSIISMSHRSMIYWVIVYCSGSAQVSDACRERGRPEQSPANRSMTLAISRTNRMPSKACDLSPTDRLISIPCLTSPGGNKPSFCVKISAQCVSSSRGKKPNTGWKLKIS